MAPWQAEFLRRERLDKRYLQTARRFFDPLARQIAAAARRAQRTLIVGINGSQGSGKSTLCAYTAAALSAEHGLSVVPLSLDDFYLTLAERRALAAEVHPLLRTRGVPGTHDMALLRRTLKALCAERGNIAVPSFDKAVDDRRPADEWQRCAGPINVVLLEGWCLGVSSVPAADLREPLNDLERDEDADGRWRQYSNACIERDFEPLYRDIDLWVLLKAPSFEQVFGWRREQEEKLRAARGGAGSGLMDDTALRRFVAHFERHTRACLQQLPDTVDVCLELDADRQVTAARGLEVAP